jgi:hypothetical protein
LEDLDTEVEINTIWETIRENIKIPWFVEGCSKLLDQRKQAKLQRLEGRSEINGDILKM